MNEVLLNTQTAKIGSILKIYREKSSRSQGEIAEKAGISVSMLSQIERGKVAPSVDTLIRVCVALDLDVTDLFRRLSLKKPVRILRHGQRLVGGSSTARFEQLATSTENAYPAELFLLEVGPGRQIGHKNGGHEGIEMGYILKGRAILKVGTQNYELNEGDSVSFCSQEAHSITNSRQSAFKAVWSAAPPHIDYLEASEMDTNE